jgi:16S rRNA (adenine1518-N6/adenine1519-N6)-dimethyltransferase
MKNNKALGQHWLKNREILDEIAQLAREGQSENAVCLEIGPGLGTLTSSLLRRFQEVIAVEFDQKLAENLPKSFPGKNLRVVQGDILQTNIAQLVGDRDYIAVGNIPYYITSPIVRHLLAADPAPQQIVLLMQKEVAERIAAEPGNHSLLSLFVQNQAEAELGPVVKAAEFTPPPKVDSQVIILKPLDESLISAAALKLASQGFSNPRKKLSANLATVSQTKAEWEAILQQCSINPAARAQDLDLWDWQELANFVKKS